MTNLEFNRLIEEAEKGEVASMKALVLLYAKLKEGAVNGGEAERAQVFEAQAKHWLQRVYDTENGRM